MADIIPVPFGLIKGDVENIRKYRTEGTNMTQILQRLPNRYRFHAICMIHALALTPALALTNA